MNSYSFSDLRCHYQTGRSYVISGEGRNRVYGYRTGIQCDLGDIEQKEWCQMVKEVIQREGEQKLYQQLLQHLKDHNYTKESIKELEFKAFERLQANIEKSRHCTLAKFIAGLGIPMVGRHAGRDLDRYFDGSWDAFEQAIRDGFDFTQLPDFGKTMHDNIYTWYADAEEAKLWRPLLNHIEFVKETSTMTTLPSGKIYIQTQNTHYHLHPPKKAEAKGVRVPVSFCMKTTSMIRTLHHSSR